MRADAVLRKRKNFPPFRKATLVTPLLDGGVLQEEMRKLSVLALVNWPYRWGIHNSQHVTEVTYKTNALTLILS
jgi:hypothetical protein